MRRDFVFTFFVCMFLLSIPVAGVNASPQTTVYVYPEISEVKVGETFTVDIKIGDVSGLQGLDFRLTYDTCILDGLKVVEGPFMASGGPTFVIKMEVEDEIGLVWVAIVIYGEAWADGSGTLATITFNATASGETVLNLSSDVCTCGPEWIPHTDLDGYVTVSADPADPPDSPDSRSSPDPPDLDVNGDGIFDVFDVVTVAKAFGSRLGDANWNSLADLNDDDVVDIYDAILVVQNFGQE